MATTVITDETVTIALRMGATLSIAIIDHGEAEVVYTLPGQAEQTVAVDTLPAVVYGPYPFGVNFEITATNSVQADTSAVTEVNEAIIQQVESLPSSGQRGVIYQTATAAYWWNGVSFIVMGSGAAGSFTSLTVTGASTITANSASPALDVVQNGAGIGARIRPGTDQTLALVIDKAASTAGRLRAFVGAGTGGYVADDPYIWSNNADIHFRTGVGGASEPLALSPNGATVGGYIAGSEQTAPAAPAANGYRIFAQDNGAGKTQLMVIFATGAAQQLAIEP